ERADAGAALADFALSHPVVGIVPHEGRQIERDGQAGLSLREQVVVAGVGFLRRGEAGELAHGPQSATIHIAMNATRVGKFPRPGDIPGWRRLVERLHCDATDRGEAAFREPRFAHLLIMLSGYSSSVSRLSGEKTACFVPGYGVSHPRMECHRIRFSLSEGTASGTSQRILAEARAPLLAGPLSARAGGLISTSDCLGAITVYGLSSAVLVKLARISLAIRSNSESVGSPRISSIVFNMLWCA